MRPLAATSSALHRSDVVKAKVFASVSIIRTLQPAREFPDSSPEFPDLVWEPPGPARELPDPVQELPHTDWELPNPAQELSDPVQVAPDLVREMAVYIVGDVGLWSGLDVSGLDLLFGFRGSRVAIWTRFVVWASCESGVCRVLSGVCRVMSGYGGLLSGLDLLVCLDVVGVECMSDCCLGSVFV